MFTSGNNCKPTFRGVTVINFFEEVQGNQLRRPDATKPCAENPIELRFDSVLVKLI